MTSDRMRMHLRLAFQQPGCALCRIRHEAEHSYVLSLLGERFTDDATRRHLHRSLGLCYSHAWALQAAERQVARTGMATGMLYQSLIEHVIEALMTHLDQQPPRQERATADRAGSHLICSWRRLKQWWRRRQVPVPHVDAVGRMTPTLGCPACEMGAVSESTAVRSLVNLAADTELRAAYAASDSLCLPHLRRVMEETDDADTLGMVVEKAVGELSVLKHNLNEFIRKHSWQYHEESKPAREQAAWIRAVAFVVGEAPAEVEEYIQAARRGAQSAYHQPPASAATDEKRLVPDSERDRR